MKKIAILGTAPSTVRQAPYDDPSWDIWSIGANQSLGKRYDRWFELHSKYVLESSNSWHERVPFLKAAGSKLMVGHHCVKEELPESVFYPVEKIVEVFGPYFSSTISWLIALAIYEGCDELGLWGVDMIGEGEYNYQRAGCEHYLGIAKGKGIKVTLPPQCPLLRAERMYGFEYTRLGAEMCQMNAELDHKADAAESAYMKAHGQMEFYRGQKTMLKTLEMRWG